MVFVAQQRHMRAVQEACFCCRVSSCDTRNLCLCVIDCIAWVVRLSLSGEARGFAGGGRRARTLTASDSGPLGRARTPKGQQQ